MPLGGYVAQEIDAATARPYVKKYHYSGKVVSNSSIHLGVFNAEGDLCGVLQYGPPMNGAKTAAKISDTHHNMMELNRMVMRDEEPRNSESMAISACNKWLRANTDLDYLLSFSDGKEGNVGYIYQATNWQYLGFMLSDSFYLLDGQYVHNVTVWHRYKEKHEFRDFLTTDEILSLYFENISKVTCKQHVYAFPLHRKVRFLHGTKPYPKLETEVPILRQRLLQVCSDWITPPLDIDYFSEPLIDLFGRKVTPNAA
jgi:hypothetical protein